MKIYNNFQNNVLLFFQLLKLLYNVFITAFYYQAMAALK